MDQLDSLEDWVAIKEHPFLNDASQRTKLYFKVAWNDAERKFCIECTKQHRVTRLDSPSTDGLSVRIASFTLGELNAVHNQLSLVHPRLGPYIPALPEEPRGLWSYFSPSTPPLDSVQICDEVRSYLSAAFDICGEHLLVDTLFEECKLEEYFEKISELRRRSYDEALRRAAKDLQKVLLMRAGSINMLDMVEVYKLEDEVMFKWNVALAELYNYLIQPFLDVRAPAMEKLMEARKGLQELQHGDMTQEDCVAILSEWQKTYVDALDSIQELYIEYYNRTVALLTDAQDRMLADKNKFGKKSFEVVAKERFIRCLMLYDAGKSSGFKLGKFDEYLMEYQGIRVSEDLSAEKIQLLQNTKKHYENQRDKIKQEIASLDDQPGLTEKEIATLERKAYEWQVKIYDSHLDILQEDEKLIRLKMNVIKQEIAAKEDEVTFYDAVENPDDFDEVEDELMQYPQKTVDPRLKQLDCKIAAVCRKKAAIRNKKKALIEAKNLKVQKRQNEEKKIRNHHNIQFKRDENKAEVQRKQEVIEEERRKTIERLKQYRMKYATPSTIRPPRRQSQKQDPGTLPNVRLTNTSVATDRKPGATVHPETSISQKLRSRRRESGDSVDAGNTGLLENHEPQSLLVIPVPLQPPPFAPPPPPPPPPPPINGAPLPPPLMPPNFALPPTPSAAGGGKQSGGGQKLNGSGAALSSLAVNLKTIQDAKGRLKKTDLPSDKPVAMPFVSMMQLIKQKEKLRPVKLSIDAADGGQASSRTSSSDDHIKHLQEALERINRSTRHDEDSDDADEDSADFSN